MMYDEVVEELDRNQAERELLRAMKSILTVNDSMDELNKEVLRLKDKFEIPDGEFGKLLSIVEEITVESELLYVCVYSAYQARCGERVWDKARQIMDGIIYDKVKHWT